MNRVIKIRIMLDYDDVVFRDIEITCGSTFADLHQLIQEAFSFDDSQMASFYVSNEEWEKGQEITLMDMGERTESGEPILLMHDTLLRDVIFDDGQKLLYVFDFFLMWCFYLDVVRISELEETTIVPRITQQFGDAPDQHSKSPDINFEIEQASPDEQEEDIAEFFDLFGLDQDHADGREL